MNSSILIVDDSLTVRMDLKETLETSGFETTTCATLESAREACRERRFDLVVLDVLLPDGDGLELLRELKAAPLGTAPAVLLLSSEDEVRDRVLGLKTGADDYVGKPYDPHQIVARTRELVRNANRRAPDRPLVVVVDDSPTVAGELSEVLKAGGYDVALAPTGEEGLRLAADLRPAALVVDQGLPGIDGVEVIRRVRADAALRRSPCVLLTASEKRTDELRALEAGADAYCVKQAGASVVLAKLAALLRKAKVAGKDSLIPSLLSPKRILAVDDSSTFLGELSDQLRNEGYDVVAARSGTEALELLGSQPVDGILLDLVMPEMSGEEACKRIKAEPTWRDIPLLILTAHDERSAMIAGINAGADDYIAKSGDFEILKARLRAQLRRRQFEDENREIREQLHRREMEAVEVQALRELSETRAALIASLETKNSELARTNQELLRAKEAVEAANKELESFSYSVSHDLRAPLRHVDGFVGLLEDHAADKLDDKGRRYLNVISGAARQMGRLIDDLLAFSRNGRVRLQLTPVASSELVAAVVAAGNYDPGIEWVIGALPTVQGDPALLRQVWFNLVDNAVKYSAKSARPRIVISADELRDSREVVFSVADNGVGFDMAHAENLFGVFQRLHSAADFEGTGIGLANVRRIVARHGGRTWAEGRVGEGATFSFSLPASPDPQSEPT